MTINPAYRELIDLAAAMRGPDWARALDGALANSQVRGTWDWPKAYAYAFRMLLHEEAHPRELIEACNDPLQRKTPTGDPAAIIAEAKARAAEAQAAGPRATADTPQRAKRDTAA